MDRRGDHGVVIFGLGFKSQFELNLCAYRSVTPSRFTFNNSVRNPVFFHQCFLRESSTFDRVFDTHVKPFGGGSDQPLIEFFPSFLVQFYIALTIYLHIIFMFRSQDNSLNATALRRLETHHHLCVPRFTTFDRVFEPHGITTDGDCSTQKNN